MARYTELALAATGSTGNNTHAAVTFGTGNQQACFQLVVEVAGGSPTVTWKVQGSHDNSNWYDVLYVTDATDTASASTLTSTGVGAKTIFVANAEVRAYRFYRLVTSLNTNITYRASGYNYWAQAW